MLEPIASAQSKSQTAWPKTEPCLRTEWPVSPAGALQSRCAGTRLRFSPVRLRRPAKTRRLSEKWPLRLAGAMLAKKHKPHGDTRPGAGPIAGCRMAFPKKAIRVKSQDAKHGIAPATSIEQMREPERARKERYQDRASGNLCTNAFEKTLQGRLIEWRKSPEVAFRPRRYQCIYTGGPRL